MSSPPQQHTSNITVCPHLISNIPVISLCPHLISNIPVISLFSSPPQQHTCNITVSPRLPTNTPVISFCPRLLSNTPAISLCPHLFNNTPVTSFFVLTSSTTRMFMTEFIIRRICGPVFVSVQISPQRVWFVDSGVLREPLNFRQQHTCSHVPQSTARCCRCLQTTEVLIAFISV